MPISQNIPWIRYLLAVFFLFVAGWILFTFGLPDRLAVVGTVQNDVIVAPEVGAYAPPINVQTVDGISLAWADLRGKPIVVNFWATWCTPCRVEMPELQRLQEQFSDHVYIIGVNLDETPAQIASWVDEFDLSFSILRDDGYIADTYRLRSPPSTFVINPDGMMIAVFYGPVTGAQLESSLAEYLPSS